MKTSVDISEPLFNEAKQHAAESKTTLRELIERGLRLVLEEERVGKEEFVFRDATVDGNGLSAEFEGTEWNEIRRSIYEGHGG